MKVVFDDQNCRAGEVPHRAYLIHGSSDLRSNRAYKPAFLDKAVRLRLLLLSDSRFALG